MSGTFKQWLQASFDHTPPATAKEQDWYWEEGFESFWEPLQMTDAITVKHMTRLFLEPDCLNVYSIEQVAEGIWFLIGGSSPCKASCALLSPAAPLSDRVACIAAIANFFRSYVVPATTGPADTDSNPFHLACYMWWHIFPLSPTHVDIEGIEPELHITCLKVLGEVLDLPSEVCQLSALHGLNHWHGLYPAQVEGVIDAFLGSAGDAASGIREYAAKARAGLCQ
jgi:hypothetical protein